VLTAATAGRARTYKGASATTRHALAL